MLCSGRYNSSERIPSTHCTGGWVCPGAGFHTGMRKITCISRLRNITKYPHNLCFYLETRFRILLYAVIRSLITENTNNNVTVRL
jgi:hypothetical protein